MEERKKYAKEIQKMFDKRLTPLLLILGGILLVGLAGCLIPNIVVKIIVDNNDMIIFFDLTIKLLGICNTLAGRARNLVIRVILSDIFLKQR